MGQLAKAIGHAGGLSPVAAADLAVHGALHDIGKLGIRAAVLVQAGPLTSVQRRIVQRHTLIGAHLLGAGSAPILRTAARVAAEHHEHWDGGGYPYGLRGEAIHPSARIVALADVYDALTSERPYRSALAHAAAMTIMRAGRGSQFDPGWYDVFEGVVQGGDGSGRPT